LLVDVVRQRSGSQTLTNNAENHGELVDDELCATVVIRVVPHVAGLELAPLHLLHVETPNYRHRDRIWMLVMRWEMGLSNEVRVISWLERRMASEAREGRIEYTSEVLVAIARNLV